MKENKYTADEDSESVSLCKNGDIDAFEFLVKKHQKRMLNIAFRMIGNYEEACEVVQDAFVSAHKNIRKFEEKARFSTWLCTIVMNLSKNRIKQMRVRGYHEGFSMDEPFLTEDDQMKRTLALDEPSIFERLEKKEIQQKVQVCIDSLENEFREVLVLRDMQGFPYDEISGMLKIPEGTVKSRLFRARSVLRECLSKIKGAL